MICINLKNTDPFFCLAAEEYLLKKFTQEIFMLWQSNDTVVVGKHQNVMAEVNYPFVRENNIGVARRISGGGTVFHDSGNVNFAFIKNVKSPAEISFKMFTVPIIDALAKLGIQAETSGRNDLIIGGLKISGNAEHIFKNRVLHHGTLLYNSELSKLGQAIKVIPGKYISKAVESNRSPVVNISSFLKRKLSTEDFKKFLLDVQLEKREAILYELSKDDIWEIEHLSKDKFETWEWNFGYSPKYKFQNEVELEARSIKTEISVERGIIKAINIGGSYFTDSTMCNRLMTDLKNKRHFFEDVYVELTKIMGEVSEELVYSFF